MFYEVKFDVAEFNNIRFFSVFSVYSLYSRILRLFPV